MGSNPGQGKARVTTPRTKPQTDGNRQNKEVELTEAELDKRWKQLRVEAELNEKIKQIRSGGTHLLPLHKEYLSAKVEGLRERFLYIIETMAADKYRYEWLENHTGISAARWQHVLLEKQFPTLDMLAVAIGFAPRYTYWLMHGYPQPSEKEEGYIAGPTAPSDMAFNTYKAHLKLTREKRKSKAKAK